MSYTDVLKYTSASREPNYMNFTYKYPSTDLRRFLPVTWTPPVPGQAALRATDIAAAAKKYDIPAAHLHAAVDVESAGHGFILADPAPARPKILFEAHWFYKLTPKPVSRTRPDLSSKRWNPALYKGGSMEWDRLRDAMTFDELAALKSASWGLGQIMGFNHDLAGCKTIISFVEENFEGEAAQLNHMLNFIDNNGLLVPLKKGHWDVFARGYNGPAYAENEYDKKLATAAARYK